MLIVGIDGASQKVFDALFAAGRAKNLKAIAERGSFGPLRSEDAVLLSPRVWTTIATGKWPEKHGVLDWVKISKDAKADLYYSTDRQGYALWNILSEAGKSVAVVNWLITYPPDKIDGVMISDHTLASEVEGKQYIGDIFAAAQGAKLNPVKSTANSVHAVYPAEWEANALAPEHTQAVLTTVASPFRDGAPDNGFSEFNTNLREFWNNDQRLTSMALEILDKKKPDVTMVLLQGIDHVSHFLFGCIESPTLYPPSFTPTFQQRMNCQRAIYDYYEYTDELIGRLLAHFDDNDLILVVSDHGFEAEFEEIRTGGHTTAAALYGVCFARGPRIAPSGRVVGMTVADVTPTVLDWYGLPLGADMDGKPAPFLEPAAKPSPKPIPTWDTKPVERVEEGASGGETKVKEQLKSLGYLQ